MLNNFKTTEEIQTEDLQIPKAKRLAFSLDKQDYVSLICCYRQADGTEQIILDVEVEIPQLKVHDIRSTETLAISFDPKDEVAPDVLALREDFPKVPHLNVGRDVFPRSLCLFEEPYSELKVRWTPYLFINTVRQWLALTARGELHGEDQPLEPLLYGSEGFLVLPDVDYLTETVPILVIASVVKSGVRKTFIAQTAQDYWDGRKPYLLITIRAEPQLHGVIYSKPNNLTELHEFMKKGNIDLLEYLRKIMKKWRQDPGFDQAKNSGLILLIIFPKLRSSADDSLSFEMKAFITTNSIVEIGEDIGAWGVIHGAIGQLLELPSDKIGESIHLDMLNPTTAFSPRVGSDMSGLKDESSVKIALVGVGALGSQVIMNLARMGYGQWILIDDDVLLPHNLSRHALTGPFVGHNKAESMAAIVNHMLNKAGFVKTLPENVLRPSSTSHLSETIDDVEIILDATASVAAARYLAHDMESTARRISVFLNPAGSALVMLAEDEYRCIPLDALEMQYYRALIRSNETRLVNHLQRDDETIRYGTSCRDISSKIPQDLVAIQAAICSRAFRQSVNSGNAFISIWSTLSDSLTTERDTIQPCAIETYIVNEWQILTDTLLLDTVSLLRDEKLPNETGGILIGSYDMERQVIYVVDAIPAPPDSVEWPTVFIRGSKQLSQQVKRIQDITHEQLTYVGEWHSHPSGVGTGQSGDDTNALAWLAEMLGADGLPGLMLIVGDKHSTFYLREES